jgi:hypothetical protein
LTQLGPPSSPLSNGLPGERIALFPTENQSLTVLIKGRHLAYIPVSVLQESQEWAPDLRGNTRDGDYTLLGGTSLVVTDIGYCSLGQRKGEMLVVV